MPAEFLKNLLTSVITGLSDNSKKAPSNLSGPKEDEGYYVWNKGDTVSLSPYFGSSEMSCRCNYPNCKKQRISKILIEKLGTIRKEIKQPLIVTSAYRCSEYQSYLRAAGVSTVVAQLSQHELGNAADVIPKDRKMEGFEEICSKEFESIGLSDKFLHLDLRTGKKRRWNY